MTRNFENFWKLNKTISTYGIRLFCRGEATPGAFVCRCLGPGWVGEAGPGGNSRVLAPHGTTTGTSFTGSRVHYWIINTVTWWDGPADCTDSNRTTSTCMSDRPGLNFLKFL